MYGERKLIAQRTPLAPFSPRPNNSQVTSAGPSRVASTPDMTDILSIPLSRPITGETTAVTLSEFSADTETEYECEDGKKTASPMASHINRTRTRNVSKSSNGLSQHDLLNKYFRRDTV